MARVSEKLHEKRVKVLVGSIPKARQIASWRLEYQITVGSDAV
jgi:hypothetical protein